MKRTSKYQFGYFEEGDTTSSSIEMQRWETLDVQLFALYDIIGNGVIDGWNIIPSSGLSIVVAPGSGNVNFVAVKTADNTELGSLTPNTRNYIYAALVQDSYWEQTVSFVSFVTEAEGDQSLYLGYVDTNNTDVTDVNIDSRAYIGFISLIRTLISEHRHIGGTGNPPPVNLGSEVQGIIGQANLPDLDASIIQTGTINQDRLPAINHITQLINQGTLTHAQLDSFVEALSIENPSLMGETSTIDLLQLILALKHVYPDIDEYLVNELAYIPGISPDSYVDWDNTTATVDTNPYSLGGQHTITGSAAPGKKAYTYTWDSETEFKSDTYSDVFIDGSSVCLEAQETTLSIDDFSDLSTWNVVTNDLSSLTIALSKDSSTYIVPPASAKLVVGDQTVEIALVIQKQFDAQDWSQYDKITFFLKTESVQHGDVFFFLNDATSGTQSSHTKVLERNQPTINVDTLQNGWQEITVNISSYTRSQINTMGFYISSQDGWDTSKGFDLNLDDIYLTTGNKYKENGYMRVIFGSNFLYDFWRVRWNASIPTDSQSVGLVLKYRTRVANTQAGLLIAGWSAYSSVSGSEISLPSSNLYKYIEIEMFFEASDDFTRSASLLKLFLDFYTSDVDNSFTYDTKDEWDSGSLFSIDTATNPGSMQISETDDIDDIFFGLNAEAVQLDDNLVQLYKITGSSIPRNTSQVIQGISPIFGLITGVARGNNGNIWITDTDYDRVAELDKYGQIVRGFYGSWLSVPIDNYGTEDEGPGSNTAVEVLDATTTTTSTTTLAIGSTLDVLHSIYNSNEGVLYIVFNENLENIYASNTDLNLDRMYLKIGSQKFYLDDSIVELLGVGEDAYNNWYSVSTSSNENVKFLNQFKFTSHVLKINIQGADKTLLNYMVDQTAPSIIIGSPCEQQRLSSSVTVNFLLYNFILGSSGLSNRIRVTLDSGTPQDIYNDNITFNSLSSGVHTIKGQLVDADGTLNTNIEAIAEGTFVVGATTVSYPYISLQTPTPNQIYSSSPVVVEFTVENFPVLSTGQHIRYTVDSDAPVDYYSTDPITISGLDAGAHTIKLALVNSRGTEFGYTYGSVTGDFIIGLNSNARVKLYVDPSAIYNVNKKITTTVSITDVDVSNVYFANIYSPIDIQVIPCDTSEVNPSGLPSALISKLRSQSWTNGLGEDDRVAEFTARINAEAASNVAGQTTTTTTTEASQTTTTTTTSIFASIETPDLIYGTKYLDGHSVVQMSMDSEILMSNNAAIFAKTKASAKTLLGSAEKLGDSEILIGDAYNKRAIITATDLATKTSRILWQFDSDRYISDFHIVIQDDVVISVGDDAIDETDVFIRQGSLVIWENNSASPVSIYSGTTTYDQFQADPDLNLYGDVFVSGVLQPGSRFSFKIVTVGEYNWFTYPSILTGKITVTRNRVSSRDQYIVLESDGLDSPFSSRVIKVDSWGNVTWSFGESYIVKPRDARPLLNGGITIST